MITQEGVLVSGTDRYGYAYDAGGNRLWKENLQEDAPWASELYSANGVAVDSAYDKLDRLLNVRRGTLTNTGNWPTDTGSISGAAAAQQQWVLDGLGNWTSYKLGGASWTLQQTRVHNKANEIDCHPLRNDVTESRRNWWRKCGGRHGMPGRREGENGAVG